MTNLRIPQVLDVMSNSSFSEAVKAQLTCRFCLNIFHDPRRLDCGHSFCYDCCYRRFSSQDGSLICGICNRNSDTTPQNIPTDYSAQRMLEMYQTYSSSSSSTTTTSDAGNHHLNVSNKDKCVFPGCDKDPIRNGPVSQLEFCRQHFDEDVKKLQLLNKDLNEASDASIGPNGLLTLAVADLKSVISATTARHQQVGLVFKKLEEMLAAKYVELDSGFEAQLQCLHEELKKLREAPEMIATKKSSLDTFMKNKDYEAAEKTMRQLKCLLESCQRPNRYFGADSCTSQSLQVLSKNIKHQLEKRNFYINGHQIKSPQDLLESFMEEPAKEDKVVDLPYEVYCISVCPDAFGYFHDSSVKDCQACGITGKVGKKQSNLPIPRQCFICCFKGVLIDDTLVVFSMNGDPVSLIRNHHGCCMFVYGDAAKSLFLSDNVTKKIIRMTLCGNVITILELDSEIYALDFVSAPPDQSSNCLGRLGFMSSKMPSYPSWIGAINRLTKRVYPPEYTPRDRLWEHKINIYDVQDTITPLTTLSTFSVCYAVLSFDKVFVSPLDDQHVYVYSIQTGQSDKTIQTSHLHKDFSGIPMELCLASNEGILFIKERVTARVGCFNADNGEFLGLLPFTNPSEDKESVIADFNRMCLLSCPEQGLLKVMYVDMSGKRVHIVDF